MRLRYKWIYKLTKHIGNVKILILEDNGLTKEDYTMEGAVKDCEKVKAMIGKPIDVVFCGSDYDESSFRNIGYPESKLVIFPRNGISSTQIRENPYLHWDWLPNIVKSYYTKKVLIIGGESTGKSTLTINLANRFNTNYIEEAGRTVSERLCKDEFLVPQDFTEILLQHKLNEINAMQFSNKVLFIDTDALITYFYISFLNEEENKNNLTLADAIDALNSYDLILFFEPDVKCVNDGTRNGTIEADRVKYSEKIKNIFINHGKKFETISGDYNTRYLKSVELVNNLLGIE